MNCSMCKLLLDDSPVEKMDQKTLREFEDHARQCPSCGEALEDSKIAQTLLQTAFPGEEFNASPRFFSELWQTIEHERSKPFLWMAVRDLAFRFALGVAVILATLIAVDAINAPPLNENQMAIDNYLEAPGAPDSFRDVLIGDLGANRDQLLTHILQRDRQSNPPPAQEVPGNHEQKK